MQSAVVSRHNHVTALHAISDINSNDWFELGFLCFTHIVQRGGGRVDVAKYGMDIVFLFRPSNDFLGRYEAIAEAEVGF
jgi:hypothetical protein